MRKPFKEGDSGDIGGIQWRVDRGYKAPDDLKLMLYCPYWVPVKMALTALTVDFHDQIEDILYPPPRFQGGGKFRGFIRAALRDGHESASGKLEREREAKRRREAA